MSFFPFFIDLEGKNCVVAGGGMTAYRKTLALLEYGAVVHVIAPEVISLFYEKRTAVGEKLTISERKVEEADLEHAFVVIAATNDNMANRRISHYCKNHHILVNVVDEKEECSFYFPSLVKRGEIVIGITSGGNSPVFAKELRKDIDSLLPEYYGELAERLGDLREVVKQRVENAESRKVCFEELLRLGKEREGRLTPEEIDEIISRYRKS